ncbi:hypothetical protein E3N88_28944 [Mikania micrantha]|uniref:PB1-like domain-containing protein n=1 Tax=Mikania micrantha TaxID=192012 RepID=A0A5N6N0X1_9ASTR|nr:hypothetical protein E3N88_28944 [Mikania micrantha]
MNLPSSITAYQYRPDRSGQAKRCPNPAQTAATSSSQSIWTCKTRQLRRDRSRGIDAELRHFWTENQPYDEDDGFDDDDAADEDGEDAAEEVRALLIGLPVATLKYVAGGWAALRVCVAVGSCRSGVSGDGPAVIRHCPSQYVNGKVDYVDMIDTNTFSFIELETMLQQIGYPNDEIMFYHFLIPDIFGLRPIRNDQDTTLLLQYVSRFKVIQVYTEQGSSIMGKVFPAVEDKYCLRHIHENMMCKWRGNLYKDLLWKCANATTIPQFIKHMETIKNKDATLCHWYDAVAVNWDMVRHGVQVGIPESWGNEVYR